MTRDFVGYGPEPPHADWPGGARVAVNFVINFEEGSELSHPAGDGVSEVGLIADWWGAEASFVVLCAFLLLLCLPIVRLTRRATATALAEEAAGST